LSNYPLIYLQGWEEERIERALKLIASAHYGEEGHLLIWSPARGFTKDGNITEAITDPTAALLHIADAAQPVIYLMKDLPAWFEGNPALARAAREVYYRLRNTQTHVFFSHPELILPEALKKEVFLIEMDLPTEAEILEYREKGVRALTICYPPGMIPQGHLHHASQATFLPCRHTNARCSTG
jgi:hypothetical protein